MQPDLSAAQPLALMLTELIGAKSTTKDNDTVTAVSAQNLSVFGKLHL